MGTVILVSEEALASFHMGLDSLSLVVIKSRIGEAPRNTVAVLFGYAYASRNLMPGSFDTVLCLADDFFGFVAVEKESCRLR